MPGVADLSSAVLLVSHCTGLRSAATSWCLLHSLGQILIVQCNHMRSPVSRFTGCDHCDVTSHGQSLLQEAGSHALRAGEVSAQACLVPP